MGNHMFWSVNPNDFMKNVDVSVVRITSELAEEIFDGVVEKSPVETGSFRQSWNVSLNVPDETVITGGSAESPLNAPKFPKLGVKSGDKVIINNSTPYGSELENGHSDQAPIGMVAVTLASLG